MEDPGELPKPEPITSSEDFLERIRLASGELIPLEGKKSRLGESFYVSTRWGESDFLREEADNLLLVDMFAEQDGQFVPIGHYDWLVKNGIASGNKNRHGHLENSHPAHASANKKWATGEGFHVDDAVFINYAMSKQGFDTMKELREKGIITDESQWLEPIYQDMNIGSFLIAVSAEALQAHGVKERQFISTSKPARGAWGHFGIDTEKSVQLSKVTDHPFFKTVIQDFTGLPFSQEKE